MATRKAHKLEVETVQSNAADIIDELEVKVHNQNERIKQLERLLKVMKRVNTEHDEVFRFVIQYPDVAKDIRLCNYLIRSNQVDTLKQPDELWFLERIYAKVQK